MEAVKRFFLFHCHFIVISAVLALQHKPYQKSISAALLLEGCGAYSGRRSLTFLLLNAALIRGRRLFEGGTLSSKYGKYQEESEMFTRKQTFGANNPSSGTLQKKGYIQETSKETALTLVRTGKIY